MAKLGFNVLGPLEVTLDGTAVPLGGPKQRAVLAALVLEADRVVPVERLVSAVWGEDPHDRAEATLQVYVANLRKVLEPGRTARDGYEVLVTQAPGYLLRADDESVDLRRFERLAAEGRAALGAGDAVTAADRFSTALALWRGDALPDVPEGHRVRLAELRLAVEADGIDAGLATGHHTELVADVERLIRAHPYHERLRAQLMLALYRAGRQADALRAYAEARDELVDALGIEPGPELRDLEAAILRQDPGLALTAAGDTEQFVPTRRVAPGDTGLAVLVLPDGTRHVLGAVPCTLGRVAECDLTLADPDVSRRHAVIRPAANGGFALADLGSTNGTIVNGTMVTEHLLAVGDEILVGSTTLRFEALG